MLIASLIICTCLEVVTGTGVKFVYNTIAANPDGFCKASLIPYNLDHCPELLKVAKFPVVL